MIGLAGNVTVNLHVLENRSSYSDLIILLIFFSLTVISFSVVDEAFYYLVEGEAVGVACERVGSCVQNTRQECQGLMLHPFEEWGQLSLYILIRH